MRVFKGVIIGLLIFIFNPNMYSQENDSDFAASVDTLINSSIKSGLFRGYPLIIIQGYPLSDSIQRANVFELLDVTDIKSFETLSYDKSSQLFCTNHDGYLLIVCNRSGKKKLRKLGLK